jgi:hypothetical protein
MVDDEATLRQGNGPFPSLVLRKKDRSGNRYIDASSIMLVVVTPDKAPENALTNPTVHLAVGFVCAINQFPTAHQVQYHKEPRERR